MNCYNCSLYLKDAIESVYAQSYNNWEIVFWDNCSTDSSVLIAESYDRRLKYFLAKEHATLGVARNLALKEAQGMYVAFLDCDDVYLPKKTEIQVSAMKKYNSVCSYGGWIKIDSKGVELDKFNTPSHNGLIFERLLANYNVNFQTLMIKRDILIKNNINFDTSLKFSTDHNLLLRIAYKWPILSINELLAKYRVHAGSMSSNKRVEKMNDFDYTINCFLKLGVQKKYKNFKYISSKARERLLLSDALTDKRYFLFLQIFIRYSLIIIKEYLVNIVRRVC
jgi:glycosyltransferase involved in cell wall biosynthesis